MAWQDTLGRTYDWTANYTTSKEFGKLLGESLNGIAAEVDMNYDKPEFPYKEYFVDTGFEDFCRRLPLEAERHARKTPVFACPYPLLGCRYQH